jgi:hypothetical protein
MRNDPENVVENIKHTFLLRDVLAYSAFYETMWKNTGEPVRSQMTICHLQMATSSRSQNVNCINFSTTKLDERTRVNITL